MDSRFTLSPDCISVLLDVHDILMAWHSDEAVLLQNICEKLCLSLSFDLVWGGLLEPDTTLSVQGVAGNGAKHIKGANLAWTNASAQHPLKRCIDTLSPVCLSGGLIDLNHRLFKRLSPRVSSLPSHIYPLSRHNRCIGLLGVSTKNQAYHHNLLQLIASHAGFSLGMQQSLAAQYHIQNSLKLAAAVFDNSLEGIFITDTSGTILAANAAVTKITGYETEELLGKNPRILKSSRHDPEFYSALWHAVHNHNQWEGEIWNKRKNGEIYPEWMSISAIKDEQGQVQNYIGIFIDISKQKKAESRLSYLAYYDQLTGLPNRDLFHDRLNMAILQAKRSRQQVAVLFIDIDHFKHVNDTFGHAKGDLLLQQVALKLKQALRENDTLARMGGDEFTVILQDFVNHNDVELTARRLIGSLDAPINLDDQDLYISASIGISFYPENGDSASVLMKHADIAMYSAKNNGRKRLRFFHHGMEEQLNERIDMERQLRHALDHGELQMFYQPQINLDSGRIVGAEALLRWRRPETGWLLPGQFMPLAEETGLIIAIGEWVLREASTQCRVWREAGWKSLRMCVNLSLHQFRQSGLIAMVANILKEAGLDPQFLELELTESTAMQHVEKSMKILNRLKHSGIQIAIDDFGTGFSSLNYLKQLPLDRLKIDRSFIIGLANNPNDAAIVVTIIAMARCLGLGVIAEGVETEEQLKFLKMHACNEAQGYLFGYPIPANEFSALLHRSAPTKSA